MQLSFCDEILHRNLEVTCARQGELPSACTWRRHGPVMLRQMLQRLRRPLRLQARQRPPQAHRPGSPPPPQPLIPKVRRMALV